MPSIWSLTCIHTYTYIHTCTYIHVHTYIHTYIHTFVHTYIHLYIHTGVNPIQYLHVYNVCTNIKSHHDTSICTYMYIPYSGNYFAGENFHEWLEFVYFANKIFADCYYISHIPWIGTSKRKQVQRAHAIFTNNIFANWDRSAKFAKIFSREINPLYGSKSY